MARGRFGRRRGTGGNMSALIASLLREQRQAQDRVMFDAYQNGGLVDGKPVTDGRILGYIKQRRDGFSRDDPLWAEWDNRHTQYAFSIGESKVQLAYKQGKASAGSVAAFYRGQLSKLPKDSAFYREVAGRAAQWARAAGGAARGAARGRATGHLRDKLNGLIYKSAEFDALNAALTEYAQRTGIISGNQELTDAKAHDLRAMFDSGIYSGDKQITWDYFVNAAKEQYKNLNSQVSIQVALGNQGVTARNKRDRFMDKTLVGLNTVDERTQYETVRDTWLQDVQNAHGDPYAIEAANQKYAQRLSGVYANSVGPDDTGNNKNDPLFIGALQNEMNTLATGKATGESVAEMFGEHGDLAGTADAVTKTIEDRKLLETNKGYYGQTDPGGDFSVVPFAAGNLVGNPLGFDKSLQPSIQKINGESRLVYLKGAEVTASTILDANGNPVDAPISDPSVQARIRSGEYQVQESGTIGYVFSNPVTGQRKYGVTDPATGRMTFTDQNPFTSDVIDAGGLTVFAPPTQGANGKYVANIAAAVNQSSLVSGDPLLLDAPIAPTDLQNLLAAGIPGLNLSEQDIAAYAAKSAAEYNRHNAEVGTRDLGLQDRLGIGVPQQRTMGGGGDLRNAILDSVTAIGRVTQNVFAGKEADNLNFLPPAPPSLATPPTIGPKSAAHKPGLPANVPPGQNIVPTPDQVGAGHGRGGSWATPPPTVTPSPPPDAKQPTSGHGRGGSWGPPKVAPITKHEEGSGGLSGGR